MRNRAARIRKIEQLLMRNDEGIKITELCFADFIVAHSYIEGKQGQPRRGTNAYKIFRLQQEDDRSLGLLFHQYLSYWDGKKSYIQGKK